MTKLEKTASMTEEDLGKIAGEIARLLTVDARYVCERSLDRPYIFVVGSPTASGGTLGEKARVRVRRCGDVEVDYHESPRASFRFYKWEGRTTKKVADAIHKALSKIDDDNAESRRAAAARRERIVEHSRMERMASEELSRALERDGVKVSFYGDRVVVGVNRDEFDRIVRALNQHRKDTAAAIATGLALDKAETVPVGGVA